MAQHHGYSSGHPWYYVLGGEVLRPKQILADCRLSDYKGCSAAEIERADRLAEPGRSDTLRQLQQSHLTQLKSDLSRYRECVRALRTYHEDGRPPAPECHDIHVALSLKHNHLVNDFAHLIFLDDLLSRQKDLFDGL